MKRLSLALSALALTAVSLGTLAPIARASDADQLRQLLSQGNCPQCDLRRVGLVLADLEQANLEAADLAGANLSRANLAGANLRGANLQGVSLVGANLMGADLKGADLSGADLRDAYMIGAILDGTVMEYTNLQGTVGLPSSAGRFEDFHNWGVAAAKAGRHGEAIEYYNEALSRNPDFALTYLSRAISRQNLNDVTGAIADSKTAATLFETQGNSQGQEVATNLALVLEESQNPKNRSGGFLNSVRNTVQSVTPLLLRFLF
ncbi:MAG: pentapeptide repeat-containing protein [Prochlorothrix sp.]